MHSNFEKISILSKKHFLKFHDGVSKNAEFDADSSFFLMGSKNVQKKSYKQNTFAKSANSWKTQNVLSPFQQIWNQHKILRFFEPYMDLVGKK